MNYAFDVETDGFLDAVTVCHCLVLTDVETGDKIKCEPHQVAEGLRMLMAADRIIGHNIIAYDIPVLMKLYPWFQIPWSHVVDTLTLSRLAFPDLSDADRKRKVFQGSGQIGKHNLEAWGLRFNYPKVEHSDWSTYTPEMLERCSVDVDITVRLYNYILKKKVDPRAWELEHKVQVICAQQERIGYPFNEAKATAFTAKLKAELYDIEKKVQDTFQPFWTKNGKEVVPKRTTNGTKLPGTWEGAPYTKIKMTTFNPASRHHIANRLKALYGWTPTAFTPSGEPQVDESVLEALPWPEAQVLAKYFLILKRLALVSDGDQGWLKHVRHGRIHGGVITNGAVTGRATHFLIANVPRASSEYGPECRELFEASPGNVELGCDASGLELRMFAHFLSKWDGGAYGDIVCSGDVHSSNQEAAGLPTRNHAKTFIYAYLYGAGDAKLGSIVDPQANEAKQRKIGKALRRQFLERVPGLKELREKIVAAAQPKERGKPGYLTGLDGRKLLIRSDHAALNTLLQSAGAIVCKYWMVEIDEEIERRGWRGKAQQLIWMHDEFQFDLDPSIAEEFGEMTKQAIVTVQDKLGIRVPLAAEYKIGKNWKECH